MNDVTRPAEQAEGQSTSLTTTAPRPRIVFTPVESAMGIMDTARFEHLGRVANVMARAGLVPETLTHEGPVTNRQPVPFEVLQARCYLIANQADLWKADPNAVAQCTSLVHGRLMYEGKLVHGIIESRLGVRLRYEFGRYDARKRDIVEGDMPPPGDKALGVRVSGKFSDEDFVRIVAGSVAQWHKGDKSPWGVEAAWPRQLRYMGAREWGRAHSPGLLLGILTEDEVDEYDLARQVGHIGPVAPQPLHAGFEEVRTAIIEQPAEPKPRAERKKKPAPEKAAQEPESEPLTAAEPEPDQPEPQTAKGPQEAADALGGDDLPDALKGGDAVAEEPQEEPEPEEEPAEEEEGEEGQAEEEVDDDLPAEFKTFIEAVEAAKSFQEVKLACRTFFETALFKGLAPAQQGLIRSNTWDTCLESAFAADLPDHAQDVSAFRLWLEWCDDPEAIEGTLAVIAKGPGFAPHEATLRKAVADRVARLQG